MVVEYVTGAAGVEVGGLAEIGNGVILDENAEYPGVDDSKALSESQREEAFWMIMPR